MMQDTVLRPVHLPMLLLLPANYCTWKPQTSLETVLLVWHHHQRRNRAWPARRGAAVGSASMALHLPKAVMQACRNLCRCKCTLISFIWTLASWLLLLLIYTSLFPTEMSSDGSRQQWRTLSTLSDPFDIAVRTAGARNRKPEWREEQTVIKQLFPDKGLAVNPLRANSSEQMYYYPGREWRDTQGRPIQAHGGGVMFDERSSTFYWYGENKDGRTYHVQKGSLARVDVLGINCYSSQDLWHWNFEGIVLKPDPADEKSDLHVSKVVERPKVIYNQLTETYVMWMHVDNANYSKACVGVAISSRPQGPFVYLGSKRPHGYDSRDMTLFKDDDGQAYIVYSSEENSELHVGVLTDDYLDLKSRMIRIFINQRREAPAVFKHREIYYMITSGCTGWAPNKALVHASESMMGSWETIGNPCVGSYSSKTFYSQGTFVLPLPGLPNIFIFMADRWRPSNLRDSRYVWLPLSLDGPADEPLEDEFVFPLWSRVSIHYQNRWKLPDGWQDEADDLA